MGLQEQQTSFKFAGGIETKMDSKAVPAVRLLALENGVFTKAISIKKRNGYAAYSLLVDGSVDEIESPRHLAVRDEAELLQFTHDRCYSKQTGQGQWSDMGAVICATGDDKPIVHTGSQQSMPDHATNDGVTALAWEDSRGGVWWTVRDATSGAVYRAPSQADADGERPRCVPVGDTIHIYYAVPTQRTVMVIVVNTSSPSASVTPEILVSDLSSTNPVYDAVPTQRSGGPSLMVWYEHGTTNFRLGYVDAVGALGSPASGYPSVLRVTTTLTATTPIALSYVYSNGGSSDGIFVSAVLTDPIDGTLDATVWITTGSFAAPVDIFIYESTAVKRLAMTTTSEGTTWFAFEEDDPEPSERFCVVNSMDIAGALGTERTLRSVGLASRGFLANDEAFVVFVHDTTYFNIYLTLRMSDFAPAGRHLPGSATGAPTRTHLSSVHVVDEVAQLVLPYKTRVSSEENDKFTEAGLRLITMDFDDADSHQTAQLGRGLYLAGACPQHYDGYRWTEQGFHVGPELMDFTLLNSGSLTPSSEYEYLVWYEWTDAQGEIHRGPTSVPLVVTLGAGDDEVELVLPTLRLTRKENVRICVARSLPGDASQLFRVTSLDPTTDGDVNGYISNDTTVDSVVFVDRMSDDDLREQEPAYTNGGILSNDPVALGSVVAAGKERLFFTDAMNPSIVRFSQRIAPGFGLEVAPELMHDVGPGGGAIVALAVMDEIVFAFKETSVWAFNGGGPLENGSTATSSFSPAIELPGGVGCTDPHSLVVTPDGIAFKSAQGIWQIDRARQVSYIGSPVEAYNDQTVTSAARLPGRSQVVFLTDSGKTLLYDYLFKQWSTFTNHEGYDSAIVGGVYHYLRADGRVFRETVGEYSDAGARITLRFETSWLHLVEQLQGQQRFWNALLLGTWISPHQFGVQYRLDYSNAWSDPWWLDATNDTSSEGWLTGDNCNPIGEDPIGGTPYGYGPYGSGPYGGVPADLYQWRIGIHEDGQAIQFAFEDFEKDGLAGASFELTELLLVGGIEKPSTRPFSGARST